MQSIGTIYLSSFVFVQLNVILRMFLSVIKSGYDTVVEEKEAAEEAAVEAKAEAKAAKKVRDAAEAAEAEEERQRSMDNTTSGSINSVASSFGSSGSGGSRGREANREADRFGDAAIRQISGRSLQWWNEEQRSPGMSIIPIG